MVRLLNRALRKSNKDDEMETAAPAPRVEAEPRDRILVLIPGEGGFAFRLFAFPSILHAAAYVDEHFPYRSDHIYTFRPHHERPRDPAPGAGGPIESVVMVRDAERHGSVHLYSFIDMETAQAFIRAEGMRGLNLRLALVFWAEPVSLHGTAPAGSYEETPVADSAMPEAEEPANALFDTLTRAEAVPTALGDEIAPAPAAEPAPPVEPTPEPAPPPPPPAPAPVAQAPARAPQAPQPAPTPAPVPLMPELTSQAFDVFAPPADLAAPANTAYTSQKKEARRWNAGADFPEPSPSPADAPKTAGGPPQGFIRRLFSWPGWDGFGPVIRNAALLKWEVYDELRKDPYAAGRAGVLVGATVGAAALSAFFIGPVAFFFHGFFMAIGFAVFALCINLIGTQLFGGKMEGANAGLFLQRLGFAFAPGPLIVLGIFPVYGPLFTLVGLIWVMMTSIKATEVGLEMDRQSAAYTVIMSWLALFAVAVVIPTIAS